MRRSLVAIAVLVAASAGMVTSAQGLHVIHTVVMLVCAAAAGAALAALAAARRNRQ